MNSVVFGLSMRQLAARRRTLAIVLLAIVPVLLALVAQLSGERITQPDWTVNTLFQSVVIGIVLPLVALVLGTAALGTEFEEGTALYLLSKPIPRSTIVAAKLVASWLVTSAIVVATTVVSGAIALAGEGHVEVIVGFAAGSIGGALVYCALFLMLSIVTSRALIAGLFYVFIWEGIVTGLFRGTRVLSVREYTLSLGDLLAGTPDAVFDPRVGAGVAIAMIVIVTAATTWYGIRALERWELKGETG
ncbi:MAG: ABC transporter permease [Dehalococcoidia bacterium]|nr:ABC transporter permease [Dehalococcoidia bacterium]